MWGRRQDKRKRLLVHLRKELLVCGTVNPTLCFAAGLNVNVAKELFWEGLCALPALWVETFRASAFGISLAALSCSLGAGWW